MYLRQVDNLAFKPNIYGDWPDLPDSGFSFYYLWNELYDWSFGMKSLCKVGFYNVNVSWPPDRNMDNISDHANFVWHIPVSDARTMPNRKKPLGAWRERVAAKKPRRVWQDYSRDVSAV